MKRQAKETYLVERYPFYHAARMVMLRKLYQNHDPAFDHELRKAALFLPSRTALYKLIEADRLNPAVWQGHKATNDTRRGDRTASLIGDFLSQMPQSKPRRAGKADATVDYMEYLMQQEGELQGSKPPLEDDRISAFLDGEGKITIHDRREEDMLKPLSETAETTENAVLTEMMARIYIKQKKYEQALEIIRKLSLKYPKKNRYFADQIRFLEKLVVNEKNKNKQ